MLLLIFFYPMHDAARHQPDAGFLILSYSSVPIEP